MIMTVCLGKYNNIVPGGKAGEVPSGGFVPSFDGLGMFLDHFLSYRGITFWHCKYGRSQKLRFSSVFSQTNDVVTSSKGISILTLMDHNYSVMVQEKFQICC